MDKSYIAGFFDGEGSVGIWSQGVDVLPTLCVQVTQCQEEVIRKIHELYSEGHVSTHKATGTRQTSWVFCIKGLRSKRFLIDILPFLIVKKEQVLLALNFLNFYEENKNRFTEELNSFALSDYSNRLKELKK